MLISNTLPQVAAPQATNVAATQSAFLAAATSSASKPMTATAVNSVAAASPYTPQLPQQRRAVTDPPPQISGSGQGRPAILPDPEFWRVPDRQVDLPQPQPVRTQAETVQQTTGFVAQAAAQEVAEFKKPEPEQQAPVQRKPAALIGKKPGLGEASGLTAYNVASQRNTQISFPNTVEAFA